MAAAVEETFDRQAWLEWRRGGLGSSDAPAIAGMDPYRGPLAIWLEKTGRLTAESEEREYVRWGRLLEDAIIQEFELRTGLFVPVRQQQVANDVRPHLRATIDGFVHELPVGLHAAEDVALGVLEVKTVAGFKSDAWGTQREPLIPEHFQIQVLHQLGVTGLSHAWIAVLFGGQRLEIREMDRDEDDLNALLNLEDAFWARVLSEQPPLGDGTAGSTEALRLAYAGGGEQVTLPIEAAAVLAEREQAKAEEKAAAARAAAAEQTIQSWLGDAEVGLYDGERRVTWKRHEKKIIDLDALRSHDAGLLANFTKTQAYRQLRFVGSAADAGGE